MTIDEIKELIQVVCDTGIAELELQLGEDRVRIRSAAVTSKEMVMPTVLPVPVAPLAQAVAPIATAAEPATAAPAAEPKAAEPKVSEQDSIVRSPIVGTYYDAKGPGEPPFVRVGEHVEPKQVLCIIESMKLMNEIEAEFAGTIVAKHVENGRPVEYGESLFSIRPL